MSLRTDSGVTPLAAFQACCFSRRRSVSPMAASSESVMRSA